MHASAATCGLRVQLARNTTSHNVGTLVLTSSDNFVIMEARQFT